MSHLLVATAKAKTRRKRQQRITADYIQQHIKILDKQQQLIPFAPNRVQAHLAQNLTGRDLVLKSRQQGVSTYIRVLHESKAMTTRSRLATLAHDQTTTNMLRRMSKRMWEHLPDTIRPDRTADNATTTMYANTGSEVMIQTAGSSAGGRGGTLTDVHGSEVAFWKNAVDNMAGIMQAVPIHGNIVLESTPNGASGWFYDTCMEALDGTGIWKLHFYEWWWADEYQLPLERDETLDYTEAEAELVRLHNLSPQQIKWRRYKMKELPHTFKQEYPEDVYSCFLASGNSFFGDTSHVYKVPFGIEPDSAHRYVAGLDFGQSNDYTVMIIVDATAMQQVDKLRINKLRWEDMRARIKTMYSKWNVDLVIAEKNSIGNPNIEALQADGITIQPFETTAKSKPPLIQGLYAALHETGLLLQNDPDIRHELNNFISAQTASGTWKYEGADGTHDDCVIALALAVHGIMNRFSVVFT